jgi:hypothetical protein
MEGRGVRGSGALNVPVSFHYLARGEGQGGGVAFPPLDNMSILCPMSCIHILLGSKVVKMAHQKRKEEKHVEKSWKFSLEEWSLLGKLGILKL